MAKFISMKEQASEHDNNQSQEKTQVIHQKIYIKNINHF